MGPNVTCIMRWRKKNMSFIPMIPILTSIRPGCLPLFPEYASAMNVYPCASSSMSTRYTPIRKKVACLREKTPASAFLNSSYDGSFIAGLMELRYIQSLPVERIINYFESHGFTLKKPTAHKLIEKASNLFENLYKCIRQTALSDPYKAADETYYKILVPEKNSKGKGVRKGIPLGGCRHKHQMIYLLYDDGSRSERVILNELGSCKGIIQSDGYSPYRKLESDAYPNITRIPCLQHIKRKIYRLR